MKAPRISAALATLPQPSLFPETDDRPLTSPALIRWHVGMWFQEASRVLTGAVPHVTDGSADICPDLSHPEGDYIEVKGLAHGRESILFKHRLARDRALVHSTGRGLTYLYWIHTAPVQTARTLFQLRAMLAASTTEVLAVPFERLRRAVHSLPTAQLEYRADGTRMPAYRLCGGLVRRLAAGKASLLRSCMVHGHNMVVSISGPDLGRIFAPLTAAQCAAAGELRAELSEHALAVELIPAPRPMHHSHAVRCVMDSNPSWYSRLCAGFTAKRRRPRCRRKPDTDIRRRFVERALDRLAAGVCRYEYDWRLRPIVERHAK
jgi:hypothetical protein